MKENHKLPQPPEGSSYN